MANEDFTTYTEVDADGTITVTVPKVEWVDMDSRNVSSYVYKDFGVGHFGNLDHDIEIQYNTSDTGSHFLWWGLTNLISDLSDFWGTAEPSLMCSGYKEGADHRFYIKSGASGNQDFCVISVSTLYYCTVVRAATTMTVTIYTDAARTVLFDTLTITCTNTTLRYLYACMSNDSSASGMHASGFSQDFDLNEAVADVSAGIKIWDGTSYIELVKDNTSPVRIWTGSEAIGVKLVNPNHVDASAIHIFDGTTIKAFKKKV